MTLNIKSLIAALLLTTTTLFAQERFVTLTLPSSQVYPKPPPSTNILNIAEGEVAELVSMLHRSDTVYLTIEKDGNDVQTRVYSFVSFDFDRTPSRIGPDPTIVTGPAKFTFWGDGGLATFKIHPNQFPPDKTMVIPAGPGGANVTLECSTNLTTWIPAVNGAYTNLPSVKLFRIRMNRIDAPKGN